MTNYAPLTVKLEFESKERLTNLAKIKQRSTHWLMKKAISEYLTKEEAEEKLKLETICRWKEVEEGKFTSHSKVSEWLDTWGEPNEKEHP